jgi:threonine dehydrogenase-like Zn-dependent dehydrogenase
MRAFVMKKIGEVGVMEKPEPLPGPNDAIVKTTLALVCTSDTHTVKGAIEERTGLTLGHESVGVIHKLGSAVQGSRVGQRIALNAIIVKDHGLSRTRRQRRAGRQMTVDPAGIVGRLQPEFIPRARAR